jgi:transcription initiation factor TFIID subunit 2
MPSEKFIPQRNNFEDLQLYYLKCALILAIARFRDSKGWSPVIVRSMLIDLLRFNDNSGNKYSDSSWICLLLDLLGDSFLARPKNADDLSLCLNERVHYKAVKEIRKEDIEEFDFPIEADSFSHRNAETVKDHFAEEDHHLLDLAMEEVMKALKRDRFAASRNNCVTIACLEVE